MARICLVDDNAASGDGACRIDTYVGLCLRHPDLRRDAKAALTSITGGGEKRDTSAEVFYA
jgi:hypothetical protein